MPTLLQKKSSLLQVSSPIGETMTTPKTPTALKISRNFSMVSKSFAKKRTLSRPTHQKKKAKCWWAKGERQQDWTHSLPQRSPKKRCWDPPLKRTRCQSKPSTCSCNKCFSSPQKTKERTKATRCR